MSFIQATVHRRCASHFAAGLLLLSGDGKTTPPPALCADDAKFCDELARAVLSCIYAPLRHLDTVIRYACPREPAAFVAMSAWLLQYRVYAVREVVKGLQYRVLSEEDANSQLQLAEFLWCVLCSLTSYR